MIDTLLLGASGVLGAEFTKLLDPSHTLATHFGRAREGSVFFDARTGDVASLLDSRNPPRTAIVMLGITSVDACARDPSGTAMTNVDAVIRVCGRLRELGAGVVFASSDGVFDGSHGGWREDEEVHPILEYGRQKRRVEQHLLERGALVVRLPKLLDLERTSGGMLTGWFDALGQPGDILCATDQFFTPMAARDAALGIQALLRAGARGLFHVGGPRRLSRRELLDAYLQAYGAKARPRARIVEGSLRDLPVFEPRPLDTSMDTSRFVQATGFRAADPADVAREHVMAMRKGRHG